MRELYVYYRVAPERHAQALRTVVAMHERLRAQHPHLACRLLQRPELRDGLHTWMEVYAVPPHQGEVGVSDVLAAQIEAQAVALDGIIEGPRHVEVFARLSAPR